MTLIHYWHCHMTLICLELAIKGFIHGVEECSQYAADINMLDILSVILTLFCLLCVPSDVDILMLVMWSYWCWHLHAYHVGLVMLISSASAHPNNHRTRWHQNITISAEWPFASNPSSLPPSLQWTSTSSPMVQFDGWIEDSGAGLVVLCQDDLVHEWHASTGTRISSFQAENAALKEIIQWLSSISSRVSAIIICDWRSLVQAISNANSTDSSVIQLHAAAAVLAMSISVLIVWAPGHCGLLDNELADYQAILGTAETQPDNAHDAATWRALIHHSCHPFRIQHERLKEVYMSLHYEQMKMFLCQDRTHWLGSLPPWSLPCSSTLAAFCGWLRGCILLIVWGGSRICRKHMVAMFGALGETTL